MLVNLLRLFPPESAHQITIKLLKSNLTISGKKDGKEQKILMDSEYNIRNTLHPEFLYSSAFVINANSGSES